MKGFTVVFLMMITTSIFSQTLEEIELCTALQSNQFYSEVEADSALDRILDASGLAKNFTLTQCDNIDNAAAISYKGVRYILYDKEFLQTITDYTNDWANLFILAHEVGHHLNGHSVDVSIAKILGPKTLEAKRKQELEADEFAAFILARLGAPLKALTEPIELVVSDEDDTFSTHPSMSKRKEAIRKGYNRGFDKNSSNRVNSANRLEKDKVTNATKEKITSNYGRSNSIWHLVDFSDDPFRDELFKASVKGEVVSTSDEVVLYIKKDRNQELDILLGNLDSVLTSYLNSAMEAIKEKILFRFEIKYYEIIFDISIAVDKYLVGKYPMSLQGLDKTLEIKEKNFKIDLNNYELHRLLTEIKKGRQLFIKVEDYKILSRPKSTPKGVSNTGFLIPTNNKFNEDLIFRFSLIGSADALRWFQDN